MTIKVMVVTTLAATIKPSVTQDKVNPDFGLQMSIYDDSFPVLTIQTNTYKQRNVMLFDISALKASTRKVTFWVDRLPKET